MKAVNKDTVKLNYAADNGGWWMAKGQGTAKPQGDYPKLKVDFDHSGEFTFLIQNPEGAKFAADAFVPKAGQNNPPDFASQFDVSGQGTDTLLVKVKNVDPTDPVKKYDGGDYHYELRFTDQPPLDPIITNGGCCKTTTQSDMAFLAVGAVALMVLLYLVVRPILARRSAAASAAQTKDRDGL